MLKLRRQLPVYSPVRFRALLAGLGAALRIGRPRERLRARLARHYGTSELLLTDSGTSALLLAIRGALGTSRRRGSENDGVVALPAYCCPDVVTAAIGARARIAFYDVDPDTLGPDWDSLDAVLEAGTDAVVAVHLYGIPVDVERMADLARAHGSLLIEDAAQGFGGSVGNRPLGSLGSIGILSFGRGKGITGGGGGALLANDDAGRRVVAVADDRLPPAGSGWSQLAKLAAQWLFGRPSVYGLPAAIPWLGLGETRYEEPRAPRGISRAAAAVVLSNWDASLGSARVRRDNAAQLVRMLDDSVQVPRPAVQDSVLGALRQPIVFEGDDVPEKPPESVRAAGIERGYPALQMLPIPGDHLTDASCSPRATELARRLFTLPTHELSHPERTARAVRTWESTRV